MDFSLDNILYFLHEGWAEKLQETGLKVILLADKSMLPMANFLDVAFRIIMVGGRGQRWLNQLNQENKTHHAGAKSSLPAHAIADGA